MAEKGIIMDYIQSKSDFLADMTSKFIQTPSPSGSEGEVAKVLLDALRGVGLDAKIDFAGNVIGAMKGDQDRSGMHPKRLAFNVHLDVVPAGPAESWLKDPFSGAITEGRVYGRGASDTKGAWAPMILAMDAVMKNGGVNGDVLFTAVVMEELTYSIGMKTLLDSTLKDTPPDYIVSGEATSLNIAVGHRGRTELELTTRGRSCHASAPWRGENALYKAGKVITAIEKLSKEMDNGPAHPLLGKSTLALTHIESMPGGHNVIPDLCKMYLDYRFLPGETLETIAGKVRQKLGADKLEADVQAGGSDEVTYTGYRFVGQKYMPGFAIDTGHPLVCEADRAVRDVLGCPPKVQRWDFATDGGYSMGVLGIPTIGFSPCEEQLAHTTNEYVWVDSMVKAAKIYAKMILDICGAAKK